MPTPPLSAVDAIAIVGQVVYGEFWRRRMAERLGCSTKTLNRWENGVTQMSGDPQVLAKLAELVDEAAVKFPAALAEARSALRQSLNTYIKINGHRHLDANTKSVVKDLVARFNGSR